MAKRKKRSKSRKSKPTYDSKETKVFFGIVFLFLALTTILSYFLDGPIFTKIQEFSGQATLLTAVFLVSLGVRLLGSQVPLTKTRSVIGWMLMTISFAALLNSIFGGDFVLQGVDKTKYGGYLGYYVYSFLSDRIFLNYTPVFLFLIFILSIPVTLSISLVQFVEYIGKFFSWLMERMNSTKLYESSEDSSAQSPAMTADQKEATFGDFRKQGEEKKVGVKPYTKPSSQDPVVKDQDKTVSQLNNTRNASTTKVEIKEQSVEGAYINEELQFPNWKLPPVKLLDEFKKEKPPTGNINKNADIIEKTLRSFGVKASVVDVLVGPSVTQYALDIALGTKVKKIANLSNDLALALATAASAVRIEAPIPGTSYVGIEVPNESRQTVYSREVLGSDEIANHNKHLPFGLGKNINGDILVADLQKMPHLLIAGATGSGKSVLTNGIIVSLLMNMSPDEVKFIMVDPKQVELSDYNGIPHLLTPVITEMDKVVNALKWTIAEMERRYTLFKDAKVRNLEGYNKLMGFSAIPYIVLVVDEMADMMMSTNKVETESAIVRLAQKARATGIHLVLATQRPSVDVITGLIKANIPGRIGMSVTTQIDSRVILDHIGAESLLGQGDMLYKDPRDSKTGRIQGFWIAPHEIQAVVEFIKQQVPEVHYTKEVTESQNDDSDGPDMDGADMSDDDQFANAVRIIVNSQKGSASLLQRKLRLGYNRAARLLDELEEYGVVGPPNGSKPRDVLISDAEGFLAQNSGEQE